MGVSVVSAQELDRVVGSGGRLSMLDKKLLRFASQRLTPEQMSAKLDGILTPARCAQRVREILRSWDWLSIVEQRGLILMDMIELKEILIDRVRREGGIVQDSEGRVAYSFGDPRWASNLTKLLSEMNKLITVEQAKVDADRQGLRRAHGHVMVRAIDLALGQVIGTLADRYGIEEGEVRDLLEDAMPLAIAAVEEHVDPEDDEEIIDAVLVGEDEEAGF